MSSIPKGYCFSGEKDLRLVRTEMPLMFEFEECGLYDRFVGSCGFTPDVKVWEVCFGKKGEFQEVLRAFELKGHSASVHSFAFSNDSRR